MKKLGILASDEYLKHPDVRRDFEGFEVADFSDWRKYERPRLIEACRSVDMVLTGRGSPRIPGELATDFGRLKYVLHLHGTIRHLVEKRLIEAGLLVSNWGDSVSGVAEGAMALLLCQLKQLVTLNALTKGQTPDQRIYQMFPATLDGRDVGLYGYGPIGRHMGRMLEPFGARIAIYDPYARDVPAHIRVCSSLRELFSTCQVISIHCGLNDHTKLSVNREMLELLPQGGVVVNTARGGIVDEQALADLVGAGRLLAGIDVIHNEGNWPGSPLAPHPGTVLTHHNVGGGKGYPPGHHPPPSLPAFAVRNLQAFREDKPLVHLISAQEYDLKT